MGEAKRRRQEFLDVATKMQAEGQGVFQIEIIFAWNVPGMVLNDPTEQTHHTLMVLADAFSDMEKMQPPAMCLLCNHGFVEAPAAFVLMTARIDNPQGAIVNGLCIDCAVQDDLLNRITSKYKDTFSADLRLLPPIASPGQA